MIIKECAFLSKNDIHGNPCLSCNLLPESYDSGLNYRFRECEEVSISECPYKKFKKGLITKEKLNQEIQELI